MSDDRTDYITVFAIGAAVGIGATLLLSPRPSRARRILHEIEPALAREIVMDYDHSEADNLFDSVLSGTIFSFETNRRIFRGMIRFQDNERWHSVFGRVIQSSRWDLTEETMEEYTSRAFDFIVDYLQRGRDSAPAALDPVGDFNLGLAK
jgi:hypothetical protein